VQSDHTRVVARSGALDVMEFGCRCAFLQDDLGHLDGEVAGHVAGAVFGARQRSDIDVAYVWREVVAAVPAGTLRRGPISAQHIPTDDDAVIKDATENTGRSRFRKRNWQLVINRLPAAAAPMGFARGSAHVTGGG
jgi:hypothetical protein